MAAAIVFGLASWAFLDNRGAPGRGWGMLAVAGGILFIATAEREAGRPKTTHERSGQ